MIPSVLIGIAAGLVAAALYASVGMGTFLSVILFYLAPLPIFIACFGWGTFSGAVAAVAAGLAAAVMLPGLKPAIMLLASIALPPLWLSHLALLSRPLAGGQDQEDETAGPAREWYPLGRLIIWVASISAALVALTILMIAPDAASFRSSVGEMLTRFLTQMPAGSAIKDMPAETLEQFVAFMVRVLPAASGIIFMLSSLLNMWLAARAVRLSGRLARPEPAYSGFDFPPVFALATAAAIVASLVPGLAGIAAGAAAVNFVVAWALLGLAVLHSVTRGSPLRPVLLAGAYLLIFFFNWLTALLLAGLGLAENFFSLRSAAARGRPPPPRGGG